jgi:hypothetical protein
VTIFNGVPFVDEWLDRGIGDRLGRGGEDV